MHTAARMWERGLCESYPHIQFSIIAKKVQVGQFICHDRWKYEHHKCPASDRIQEKMVRGLMDENATHMETFLLQSMQNASQTTIQVNAQVIPTAAKWRSIGERMSKE